MVDYIYLHGFASGPQSYKGQWLRSRFQTYAIDLQLLDLNQGDFAHLTLSRQIDQVLQQLHGPTILIGSSLGGIVAAWAAQQSEHIEQLILLAPAFQFLNQWLPRLGEEQLHQWQSTGWLSVYHYGLDSQQPLHYDFLTDAQRYPDGQLKKAIPTCILHGQHDDIIALEASRLYAQHRPWVTLKPLDTDHGMVNAIDDIWHAITDVCQLPQSP
ncbi:alpha/beta fold hydrolase [Leptolyngbya cf. ectocarpi LEGE 11479]|uniref:Alpha/beta fold hydrolase n=1 Tax=Leptolyngbya cf. ectocarpi LEGE 11479 TaxID=1828722 RepID=A0A928ZQI9_LEPEC|nr:YqiA/YcfP family alpha/beta fold hydrolase [Leptolyngbya ectocarpi]MBE9066295.1 alpha/beta fold hydrolase [Leptolyngbya cf. ectocarpi LEGE 11479]